MITPEIVYELIKPENDRLREVVSVVSRAVQSIPKGSDLELIKTYFSGRKEIDSDRFNRENKGDYLELVAVDKSQGYLFFSQNRFDSNHEARMESELIRQRKLGKYIERKFTDYQEGISGFSWRKK